MKSQLSSIIICATLLSSASAVAANQVPPQDCSQSGENLGAEDSPQKAYFEALADRGTSAPIEDFLKLWYPDRSQTVDGAYFLDCQSASGHLRYVGHSVDEACKPDVLYSWEPQSHVDGVLKTLANGATWSGETGNGGTALWATISAVSTYSYGSTAIRVKIRNTADFVNDYYAPGNRVAYPDEGLQDFIINDASAIESYSINTPEIYDEVVRDILRLSSGKPAITYVGSLSLGLGQPGLDRVYGAGVPERGPQDEATLKNRLLRMIRMILASQGEIIYAKDVCQNRALHYSTSSPTYINPLRITK